MAKTSVIVRNEKRRKKVAHYAELRAKLKAEGNMEKLRDLPRDSSPTRFKNRCSITGRARGVYRKFGICRHILRKFAHEGKIPGMKKASW
ncbi:MAG: 30S ribosomal protein S14 [[Candidatus Thermochlorobacteriaceae] bacterium GBChlB]|jgi:small subunit ribosomal protein S14|nr:MAG: 30S ribosomal protein S14 [[Candidatus Thermochlorobacteriaceae] bacterium GBChlB]